MRPSIGMNDTTTSAALCFSPLLDFVRTNRQAAFDENRNSFSELCVACLGEIVRNTRGSLSDHSGEASAEGKCSATYSSASCPRDFFARCACSRRTTSFDGSTVVVMRTRFGRPDFGRPADSGRFSPPTTSSSGHTRKPSGAIVKNVGKRDAVFYKNIPRFLRDHRLHVNPRLRADLGRPTRAAGC